MLRLINNDMSAILSYYNQYMPSTSVKQITANNFSGCGSLGSDFKNGTTVVFFYIPECRFCQEFAPEFSNFADNYASKLGSKAVAVNMSSGNNNSLISMSSNFSYSLGKVWPTIIVFYNGNPCSSYTGPRTAQSLASFISKTTSTQTCNFKFVPCE